MKKLGLLCVAMALCGCDAGRRIETATLEPSCARRCEASYDRCRQSVCPQEVGARLNCTMSVCNPERSDCLAGCPGISTEP